MAELADALDSGSSEVTFVQVQVLLPAPKTGRQLPTCFYLLFKVFHEEVTDPSELHARNE